jgi:hypothetical protein
VTVPATPILEIPAVNDGVADPDGMQQLSFIYPVYMEFET